MTLCGAASRCCQKRFCLSLEEERKVGTAAAADDDDDWALGACLSFPSGRQTSRGCLRWKVHNGGSSIEAHVVISVTNNHSACDLEEIVLFPPDTTSTVLHPRWKSVLGVHSLLLRWPQGIRSKRNPAIRAHQTHFLNA